MAIDEVLSQLTVPRDQKPVLRVYGWNPFAISLGYNQNENELDLERCKQDHIDVVRRPTGGRAVFHAEELTYSIMLPKSSEFFKMDTLTVYNLISEALVEGLKLIGVRAQLVKRKAAPPDSMESTIPCFSSAAKYEIAYQGRKLVGSAQRRYPNSILQHGSILVGTAHLKLGDYLSPKSQVKIDEFSKNLAKKTISISQILSTRINYDKIIWGIKNGFQNMYHIQFLEGQLTSQEIHEAQKLINNYKKLRRKVK